MMANGGARFYARQWSRDMTSRSSAGQYTCSKRITVMHATHLRRPGAEQHIRGSHDGRAGRAEAVAQRGLQRRRRRKHGREQAQPLDVRHRAYGRRPCREASWGGCRALEPVYFTYRGRQTVFDGLFVGVVRREQCLFDCLGTP